MTKKPLLIRLTCEQLSKLDTSRLHLREKTLNKAVGRVIEEYFRINKLGTMTTKDTSNDIIDTIIKEHGDEIKEVSIEEGRIIIKL